MVQGKREWLALGVACAVAGRVSGAKGSSPAGLGMEVLEGRVNLSSLAGAAPMVGPTAQTQKYLKVLSVQSVRSVLGEGMASPTSQGSAKKDVVYATPLRRDRPTRVLKQTNENLTLVEVPNLTPSPMTAPSSLMNTSGQSEMEALEGKLYGDGVHDDSGTIQAMVDLAYRDGLHAITLPAGTFELKKDIWFYGNNVTLSGVGKSTILDVANHLDLSGDNGFALNIHPQFDPTLYMIDSAVTGNSITVRGNVDFQAGEQLFLTNGRGSMALEEQRLGGVITMAGQFFELAPDEFVTVASVTHSAGNTVLTLTQNVVGKNDYFNVAPNGVVNDTYLHLSRLVKPANHLTVSKLAVRMADSHADTTILAKYTTYLTISNVALLPGTVPLLNPNVGGFWVVGSEWADIDNSQTPTSQMSFNSTRLSQVVNCTATKITLEEATTDCLISHNTLTTTNDISLRTNDMGCQRDVFSYNTAHGGAMNTGSIGLWEGLDDSVINNVVSAGGGDSIWLGGTTGCIVTGNSAGSFTLGFATDATVSGNSWQ